MFSWTRRSFIVSGKCFSCRSCGRRMLTLRVFCSANGVRSIGLFSHFRPKPATGFPFRWFLNTSFRMPPKPWNSESDSFELKRVQLENLKKTVEWVLEKRINSLELKSLRAFVQNIAPLWSVAGGEMETSDLFDKDFLAPAAFRLTIAHEFRAPLTALQSFLLILLKGYVAPEKWKEIIQHAFDRSQEMLDLVDGLMNLAAARQEMSLENRSHVQLGDVLEKLAPSLKAEADERGLTLTLTVRQNPFVVVNPVHMSQLWTNLISNAIKYTPAGGSVQVSLEQDEAWAIGAVEDSGIGIRPQELPLIFHEFYRTAEAKNMGVRGTGLGLPLVKRIVEGYGGSLEVKSDVGKGSLFRFTLPLATVPSIEDSNTGEGTPNLRHGP